MKRLVLLLLLISCKHPPAPPAAVPVARTYEACKAALDADKLDEAEACFTAWTKMPASASTDPSRFANVLFALASIRQERGDGKGAVAHAVHAVSLRPEDVEAQELLEAIAHAAKDARAEKAALQAMARLDPDALDVKLRYATLVASADGTEAAKDAFLSYEDTRLRLLQILGKDPDPTRRRKAADRLASAKDAGTARALVLSMTDKDAGVRAAAVRAVAKVGIELDPEIKPALSKMSTVEKDEAVRAALAEALL